MIFNILASMAINGLIVGICVYFLITLIILFIVFTDVANDNDDVYDFLFKVTLSIFWPVLVVIGIVFISSFIVTFPLWSPIACYKYWKSKKN